MGLYRTGKCLLRQVLKQQRITQTQLSDKIGMPSNQISDYVNNRRKMTYDTAYNIAKGLGVPMDSLYEWVEWRKGE